MKPVALIVPVYKRFDLFTQLMNSVDIPVMPFIIENYENNRGCSGAWNEGMRRALLSGYNKAIITNDDVVFEKGSLTEMLDILEETGALMVSANQNGGTVSEERYVENADFFCFVLDIPQLINRCGTFDENFYPAYFEDNDMHRRIVLSGAKAYIATNAIVKHHGSATQNADFNNPVVPSQRFEQLREYFVKKWGGEPGQERFERPFNDGNRQIWDWDERV